jgi:4-amino-4-deoxy-L-arabinose transferase-like glycosyltransferase
VPGKDGRFTATGKSDDRKAPVHRLQSLLTGYPAAVVLLACYWAMSATGALQKSATSDELVHLTAGYTYWKYNDYRFDPENGNLPQRWMAIPLLIGDYIVPDMDRPDWDHFDQWTVSYRFFFRSGYDPEAMLWSARAMMGVIGAGLGLLIYFWARRLFSPIGAIVSLLVFVFDPTMLAHGGLATSDIAAALFFALSTGCLWVTLHKLSRATLLCSCLAMAGLFLAKMSGVMIMPIGLILIAIRLISPRPLTVVFGRTRQIVGRARQALIFLGVILVHAAAVIVLIWAAYSFRYSVLKPVPGQAESMTPPFSSLVSEGGPINSALTFAHDRRLLPEGYLFGFAHVHKFSQGRSAFLRGQYSSRGWRSFFPYCFLVKTPLPILGLVLLAGAATLMRCRSLRRTGSASLPSCIGTGLYRTAPLWVLMAVYWYFAVTSHMNIGHRHVLPGYPPLYILAGAAGYLFATRLRWIKALAGALAVWLVVESGTIWPHHLAYFNQLVGGPSKGYKHLVDSSLDWGQDLPALKQWLKRNVKEQEKVYLSYFGTSSVRYYGIEAIWMLCWPDWERKDKAPALGPGVYCISATMLQSVLCAPWGHWSALYEKHYQEILQTVPRLWETRNDPEARKQFVSSVTDKDLAQTIWIFDQFQLARLCAYLRQREPDDSAGYSILIYRLSAEDIQRALEGPVAELVD